MSLQKRVASTISYKTSINLLSFSGESSDESQLLSQITLCRTPHKIQIKAGLAGSHTNPVPFPSQSSHACLIPLKMEALGKLCQQILNMAFKFCVDLTYPRFTESVR